VVEVHQFIPTLAPRDAIGRHTLEIARTLRDAGYTSEVWASEAKEELKREAQPYRRFRGARRGARAFLLYHAAIGSPVGSYVEARPEPLIVDYHNITPPYLFEVWEPHIAKSLAGGRRQLADLATRTTAAFADSAFNERELIELGYSSTAVLPILFDPATLGHTVDDAARAGIDRGHGGADWLFVGRLAPNKAQHELVKAFAAYRRLYDPAARLRLVGASSSHRYEDALRAFVRALGLDDAVWFCGSVSDGELGAHYATADVFVCVSEHEGFLVPLLEAMHHEVPIVAFARTAVVETMGGGGLPLAHRDPLVVAAAVHRVLSDRALRDALVERGRARLTDFSLARSRARLLELVVDVAGPP
jgi:L-malate glycosyltransferase